MSRRNNVINLRITFIGAVEHIQQIEAGIAYLHGLEDIKWVESQEDGIIHLDAALLHETVLVDEFTKVRNFFERLPLYFNDRAIIADNTAVNRVGLVPMSKLPTGHSRYNFDIIRVHNMGISIVDKKGIERHHAVVLVDQWAAQRCKLDKTYPA